MPAVAKPKPKTRTFRIGPKPMTRDEMEGWLDVQMFHENLAGNEDLAQQAAKHVEDVWLQYRTDTNEIRGLWRRINAMVKGESLSALFPGADLHVPELYKMVETIVPRIVEATFSVKPWFRVEGRDKADRELAGKIQNWLHYLADQCRLPQRLEEFVRTAVIHRFFAVKSSWDMRFEKRVVRTVKKRKSGGQWRYEIKAEEKDVLAYEGVRIDLVDPLAFVIDTRATDPRDAEYVGDERWMDEEELLRLQDLGIYANVDKLLAKHGGKKPRGALEIATLTTDAAQRSERDLSRQSDIARVAHPAKGAPRRFAVKELWRKYQPSEDAPFEEYKIVSCDGICLELRKNPYDDKHRPYTVCRTAKDPHSFFGVGMLDHAVALNTELDDHRNLARKGHALSLAPFLLTGNGTEDHVTNLWDAMPGQVIRVDHPDKVREVKISSPLQEIVGVMSIIRRDIEEVVGAPRVFEGTDGGATATEVERKVQEGNRRLRGLVGNVSEALAEILRQMYGLSQQFVTRQKTFRVLAQEADDVLDIAPEDLTDPIDVVVLGPSHLEFYGLRVTQLQSFLSAAGALLPLAVQGGNLNVPALLSELWQGMVGTRLGEDILHVPQRESDVMDPVDENLALGQGGTVRVHELDNDEEHMREHGALLRELDDPLIQQRVRRHLTDHAVQHNRKLQQARAEASPRHPAFQPPVEGAMPPSRHAPGEGRYFQREPDLMGDVTRSTPPGETPGPPRSGSIAASDREPPVPQTANR